MIFQYRGEARKPRPNCSISLQGAKSSWWCCRSRGPIILQINALRNQARRRRRDYNFQNSRGLDCSGVVTQHDWRKNYENFQWIHKFKINWIQSTNGLSRHGVRLSTQGCTLDRTNYLIYLVIIQISGFLYKLYFLVI